jgi:chromosome segregation ATPase
MNKHAIRIEINNLLDRECNRCPYGSVRSQTGNTTSKFVDECQTCPHYKKLRQLGDTLLIKGDKKMKMTVKEYHQLKAEHKTDTKIAIVKNVSQQTLYNWKKKHENELKSAKNDTKTVKSGTKSPESEKTAKQEVQAKLSAKVKEQEKEISKIQGDLAATVRQVNALVEDKKSLMKKLETASHQNRDLLDQTIEELNAKLGEANGKVKLYLEQLNNLGHEQQDLLKSIQNQADTIDHYQNRVAILEENAFKAKELNDSLNAAAADHEAQIISLRNDKTDLEHQLTYIARERDHFQSLSIRFESQLRALEAYVLTILEPAK